VIVVTVPRSDQLVPEHPCCATFKPVYYAMFVEPIKEHLASVGCEVRDAEQVERGVILRFTFPDGQKVSAIVDYADQVHIDGLVKFAEGEFDFVFKMKPCDRFDEEYEFYSQNTLTAPPIHPYGYVIAPTYQGDPDDCNANRKWFMKALDHDPELRKECGVPTTTAGVAFQGGLRMERDLAHTRNLLTRGAFHAMGACPERQKLYDPDYDQGDKSYDWKKHMYDVAAAGFVLNACGPDNTIDRKVVEFCAIGSVILSNDGLKDLRLPWGGRFVHGENVWWVSSPAEVRDVVANMTEETRQKLIAGSRALWERCFAPASIGAWLVKCATEEAYA
jgi:hypothetical protein